MLHGPSIIGGILSTSTSTLVPPTTRATAPHLYHATRLFGAACHRLPSAPRRSVLPRRLEPLKGARANGVPTSASSRPPPHHPLHARRCPLTATASCFRSCCCWTEEHLPRGTFVHSAVRFFASFLLSFPSTHLRFPQYSTHIHSYSSPFFSLYTDLTRRRSTTFYSAHPYPLPRPRQPILLRPTRLSTVPRHLFRYPSPTHRAPAISHATISAACCKNEAAPRRAIIAPPRPLTASLLHRRRRWRPFLTH